MNERTTKLLCTFSVGCAAFNMFNGGCRHSDPSLLIGALGMALIAVGIGTGWKVQL
jgi:hypothetical protein